MTEKDLLKKKEEIEQAKESLSNLKGQEKAMLKQLKDEWNCSTLPEAKQIIIKLEKEIKEIGATIEEKMENLEKFTNESN